MNIKTVWISPNLFNSAGSPSTSTVEDYFESQQKLYGMLNHVDDILSKKPKAFDLENSVTAIWRVVGRRVKNLNKLYNFKKIPYSSKEVWSSLVAYGISKPLVTDRLKKLRDYIEHGELKNLPSAKECRELAEYAWYFLKSTDHLVSGVLSDFNLDGSDFSEFTIKGGPETNWSFSFWGSLPKRLVSLAPKKEWFEAHIREDKEFDKIEEQSGKYYICAGLKLSPIHYEIIVKSYFSVV